eukprot:CAMPEP_0176035542 /NCGR_PEP_ID=MMETSP0120_2-20121206/17588_1 /TAXON_ID=160619 /ORGANISM="Kryptoperidinium foliaceum, Strain CCMP 1326" /LENGTH=118 /DNA_ID=CAMNT_0017368909 /DNA_START=154 /DNA_END=508 /DNA_ORIENTATION=-
MNSAFSGAWSAPGGPSIPGFDDLNDGQVDSELRASGVKEFVPGRGWTTTSNESSKPQAPQAEPWRANNSVDAWSGDSDLNITAVKVKAGQQVGHPRSQAIRQATQMIGGAISIEAAWS